MAPRRERTDEEYRARHHIGETTKERYARFKLEGLCVYCGDDPPTPPGLACQACREVQRMRKRKHMATVAQG